MSSTAAFRELIQRATVQGQPKAERAPPSLPELERESARTALRTLTAQVKAATWTHIATTKWEEPVAPPQVSPEVALSILCDRAHGGAAHAERRRPVDPAPLAHFTHTQDFGRASRASLPTPSPTQSTEALLRTLTTLQDSILLRHEADAVLAGGSR